MKLVVLVKDVPDTSGERKLSLETGLAVRTATNAVLDEITERALEVALAYRSTVEESEVVVLSMTTERSVSTVRKALAMGADRGILVVDEALVGADITLTAEVLAAALTREGFDLVIAGDQSTDGASGMLPAALAELLELPLASGLASLEISDAEVRGSRPVEGGVQQVKVGLPAVVSITEALPEARFPSFVGVMSAKKKKIEQLSLSDLRVDAEHPHAARTIMLTVAARPPRQAGLKIVDEGEAAEQLVDFLAANHLLQRELR